MSVLLLDFDAAEATAMSPILLQAGHDVAVVTRDPGWDEPPPVQVVILGATGDRTLAHCERLRARGYTGAIVVVGAADSMSDGVAYLEHGADDFVARPLRVHELVARVRAILRRAGGHFRLERGPLSVDRARSIVRLRGRPLSLTAREYAILVRLAEADGQVLTRAELLVAVWNRQGTPGSNLIDVNLSRLRDKLGPDATLIQTIRGGGYRLRP